MVLWLGDFLLLDFQWFNEPAFKDGPVCLRKSRRQFQGERIGPFPLP